jgi:hypothetical protein
MFLPAFVVAHVLDDRHSDWSKVKSQCHFDLPFIYGQDVEHFFMHLLAICTSSFKNCV